MDDVFIIARGFITGEITDEAVLSSVNEAAWAICNYCNFDNINRIPESLYYICASMAADIAVMRSALLKGAAGGVSSVSVGDISVRYDNGVNLTKSTGDILSDYKKELNSFRIIKKINIEGSI